MAAFRRTCGIFLSGPQNLRSRNQDLPLLLSATHRIPSRGIAFKLFVGGLAFNTTKKTLSEAFSQFGQVTEAQIIMDRVSNRSKGFGFVTFDSEEAAQKAIIEMNGKVLQGRVIYVDIAKTRPHFNNEVPIARGPPEPTTTTVQNNLNDYIEEIKTVLCSDTASNIIKVDYRYQTTYMRCRHY